MSFATWAGAWLLVVMFNNTNDAKVAVFETQKDCEMYKVVTQQAMENNPNVKSIECMEGSVKEK